MATPGSTAATSRRDKATAPANPVATAATRSTTVGEVRDVTCEFAVRSTAPGRSTAAATPMARPPPPGTKRPARTRSRFTIPRAMPMMGVDRGAMIIAPMTVAVESARIPAVAMTPESTSIVQNADCFERLSPNAGRGPR